MQLFSLNKWQVLGLALYTAAFPLSNLVGGAVASFFLIVTAPFLPIGYVIGGFAWQLFGTPKAYPFGLVVGVFLQAWVLLILIVGRKQRAKSQEKT